MLDPSLLGTLSSITNGASFAFLETDWVQMEPLDEDGEFGDGDKATVADWLTHWVRDILCQLYFVDSGDA